MSEIFLSSVPKSLNADFNISGNIFIDFEAETGIESMYIKNTRKRDGEFHEIYAIVHELPREMEVSITPDTDFDMDDPPLQSLPSMNITSAGNTLDAYAFFDGKGIGQIGKAEIQVMNVADNINAKPSTDKYEVESNGVGYFWVHVMELPLTEEYTSKSIEIVGKDIKSFDVKYGAIFGTYPIITIDNTHGGELQFLMDLESGDSGRSIAMIDFKTNGGIPSSPSILINGGSIDLDKGSTHVMVPAPILSLWVDILT